MWRGRRRARCAPHPTLSLAQWSERHANLFREELRLFPRREVSAFRESVVVNQFGIGFLCPAPRGCIDLIGKYAHGSRDRDTFQGEKGKLAFPIETSRRDRRIHQPVERYVVEGVVSRQALGLTVENACDERLAARVVVEHPGGQADR